MHIDFADKSTSKSISPKVSKYQFDTLNCSLEELAVLERGAQNPSIKQQELVSVGNLRMYFHIIEQTVGSKPPRFCEKSRI